MAIKTSFDNTKNAIANSWNNMPKNAGLIGHLLECRYPYTLFAILNNVIKPLKPRHYKNRFNGNSNIRSKKKRNSFKSFHKDKQAKLHHGLRFPL